MASYEVKLRKVSTHSYAITVPKEVVQKFGWRERQKLTVKEVGAKTITVKDWKRR